ncbi:MAG: dihydroxy-acid dehydratase [Clostridia bacterium]|nr:dihydroxy-acid dehydratase [Clostridia bacterium]
MNRVYCESVDKLHIRAKLNALNITDRSPTIAIISAQNDLVLSEIDTPQVVEKVYQGVLKNGGTPKMLYISAFSDSTIYGTNQSRYQLIHRNQVADQVELLGSYDYIDGIVFVATDNCTIAGMLMGAVRLDKPCLFVSNGTMSLMLDKDNCEYGLSNWYTSVGRLRNNEINLDDLEQIQNEVPQINGQDSQSYDSLSMTCVLEALGLAIRGNCTATANSSTRRQLATQTGETAVDMAKNNLVLSKILTPNSIRTALCCDLTFGGCPTTLLHLLAISYEMKRCWKVVSIDMEKVEMLAKSVPILFNMNSGHCFGQQLEKAGGIYPLLQELLRLQLVVCDYPTCTSKKFSDTIKKSICLDDTIIMHGSKPIAIGSHLRVVKGNLAENGAILHYDGETPSFTGPAKVYESEETLTYSILDREIKRGTVVVVRNEGLSNGMREMYQPLALLQVMGMSQYVALVTDGRISTCYDGFAVGLISPQSQDQGLISLLHDGDVIEINANKGKLNTSVKPKEAAKRKPYVDATIQATPSLIKRFARNTTSPEDGCSEKQ